MGHSGWDSWDLLSGPAWHFQVQVHSAFEPLGLLPPGPAGEVLRLISHQGRRGGGVRWSPGLTQQAASSALSSPGH